MLRALALSAVVFAMPLGCGGAPASDAARPAAEARDRVQMEHHIGTYVSSPRTFSTRSFAIEGSTGLVLVDLQFTPSEAQRFVTEAERVTNKRTALAIVLHPNPDKFNGTETLQKRGVRVVTSTQVSALIPAVFAQRTASFAPRYAPDWPTATPAPEPFGDKTTELEAGGTRVRLHVLGAGCSEAHVAVEWDGDDGKHLFVGDLVGNEFHSWLELGKVDEWLARIAELRALHPKFVHPGRGATGGPELLDQEERYLRDVLRLVAEERASSPTPSPAALDRVKSKMLALYPRYDFDVFLDLGLPAVWSHAASTSDERRAR
ncbi:MAG: beta-lactamase [Myxococcaceae bacterium]|nr:beta-lactamase [Myxococcaceae bacterium]